MTAAEQKAQRTAKASLEAMLTGWAGALLSTDAAAETRAKVREASVAARRAMAQGKTPYEAMLEHVAPVLKTAADQRVEL